ncbi:MAG: T9SS type A sorting domain-containing protein [Bacteroidetes bacterium]|nr:T9SS type A sorting domain-containing protein [Bacteroidota bacterium]
MAPTDFTLEQNYPNPFNPSTKIIYTIPELIYVTLKVFDVLGQEIITLINEEKSAGRYEIEFDATALPSGIYFYKLQSENFVETKKMELTK